jgi:hypothetical protein
MLAAVVLPPVRFMVEFDVGSDDLVVVALDADQLLGHVLPEMIGDLDVASSDHDLHASDG